MDGWRDGWKGHGIISMKVLEVEEALMGNNNFSSDFEWKRSASVRLLGSSEAVFKMRCDWTLCGAVGSGDTAEINSLGPACLQMSLKSVCNVLF